MCNTCYSIDRFDGPTLQVARPATSLQTSTPQEIRIYFSRRYYPRTSIHGAVQNYLAHTGVPTFTLQLCSCLGFRRATHLTAMDTITASVRGEIFLDADVYTSCYNPNTYTVLEGPLITPVSTRIAMTFRDYGELEANRDSLLRPCTTRLLPKKACSL